MAVVQNTYTLERQRGFPGMVANGETSNRISRSIEDANGVAFGKAVFRGVGDHGVTATPAATTFMGVTISNVAVQPLAGVIANGVAADIYAQFSTASIMNEGVIWVTVNEAVNDGDPAYVTAAGLWVKTASSNTAVPAVFDDTATASGQLVRLRVRRS